VLQRTTPRRRALLPVEGVGHFCYMYESTLPRILPSPTSSGMVVHMVLLFDTRLSGRLFASRLERTRILFGTDGPASLARLSPTVQSNPASTQSWILHDLVAASESAPRTSTTAAAFSAMTRSLQQAMIVSLLCLHYLTAVTLSAIYDRASLKSECMFNNQQCRHCQPSNIKPLSSHQQSMRVVNQTHTHTHATRTRRLSGTNKPHERREHVLYCTLGSEGAEVELRNISTG
jgi:hypothetical protein